MSNHIDLSTPAGSVPIGELIDLIVWRLSAAESPPAPDQTIGIPVDLQPEVLSRLNKLGLTIGDKAGAALEALPKRLLFARKGHELTERERGMLDNAYVRAVGTTRETAVAYTQNLLRGSLPGYYIAIGPGGVELPWLGLHPDPNPGVRRVPLKYSDSVILDRAEDQAWRDVYPAALEDNPGRTVVDGLPRD